MSTCPATIERSSPKRRVREQSPPIDLGAILGSVLGMLGDPGHEPPPSLRDGPGPTTFDQPALGLQALAQEIHPCNGLILGKSL